MAHWVDYSIRARADRRALLLVLAVIVLCGIAFPLTHLEMFAAIVMAAAGLYIIRFSRLAFRDPDQTIGAWQSFYSYLRPGSIWSRRFIRALGVFGVFGGMVFIASSVFSLLRYSPSTWLVIGGSAVAALLLLARK
jgi:hypothetical protein